MPPRLPKLGPISEPQPALRCNDWLHRIKPSIQDVAPKAYVWWEQVLKEAKQAYDQWCSSSPLDRSAIKGEPSAYLRDGGSVRLESRTLAMLSKAVPSSVYDLAHCARNTTWDSCVGIIHVTLKTFQPGGLRECSELLKWAYESGISHQNVAGSNVHPGLVQALGSCKEYGHCCTGLLVAYVTVSHASFSSALF